MSGNKSILRKGSMLLVAFVVVCCWRRNGDWDGESAMLSYMLWHTCTVVASSIVNRNFSFTSNPLTIARTEEEEDDGGGGGGGGEDHDVFH